MGDRCFGGLGDDPFTRRPAYIESIAGDGSRDRYCNLDCYCDWVCFCFRYARLSCQEGCEGIKGLLGNLSELHGLSGSLLGRQERCQGLRGLSGVLLGTCPGGLAGARDLFGGLSRRPWIVD